MTKLGLRELHVCPKVAKMGYIIGHRIDYYGVGALRGQRLIPSKNYLLDFLYFLLVQISIHCLAVHFVIACIKLSSVRGENGASRGERMIRIIIIIIIHLYSAFSTRFKGAEKIDKNIQMAMEN